MLSAFAEASRFKVGRAEVRRGATKAKRGVWKRIVTFWCQTKKERNKGRRNEYQETTTKGAAGLPTKESWGTEGEWIGLNRKTETYIGMGRKKGRWRQEG
jgi:hypothetical protein